MGAMKKILRVGYYWPSMGQDAKDFVKKCEKWQRHVNVHNAPLMTGISTSFLVLLLVVK
jgi:hypothetical protein